MNQGCGAELQPLLQRFQGRQGVAHLGAQKRQMFPLLGIRDVPAGADNATGLAAVIPEHHAPGRQDVQTRIRPDYPEFRIIISGPGDGLARCLFDPLLNRPDGYAAKKSRCNRLMPPQVYPKIAPMASSQKDMCRTRSLSQMPMPVAPRVRSRRSLLSLRASSAR